MARIWKKREKNEKKKEEEKTVLTVLPDSPSLRFREGYKYLINDFSRFFFSFFISSKSSDKVEKKSIYR